MNLMILDSIGKGPRDIWDLKLSGSGEGVMTRGRFIYLHGEGKKLCCLITGGLLLYLFVLTMT